MGNSMKMINAKRIVFLSLGFFCVTQINSMTVSKWAEKKFEENLVLYVESVRNFIKDAEDLSDSDPIKIETFETLYKDIQEFEKNIQTNAYRTISKVALLSNELRFMRRDIGKKFPDFVK